MQTSGTDGNKFLSGDGHRIGECDVAGRGIERVDDGGVHNWLLRLVAWIIFRSVRIVRVLD
jgi:hypothetical protein